MSGWIKLHRSLKDWEWYDDHNATRLLIHLLVSVNYEDRIWKGQEVKSGTLITSWENLAMETGLSVKQIRTAMAKLEKSKEVSRYTTNKWQAVTLIKWDKLQCLDSKEGQTKGQAKGKRRATTKEIKEIKEENIYRCFHHLSISVDEFNKLCIDYTKQQIDDILDQIQNYRNNDKFSSLYLTAKNWLSRNKPTQTEGISPEELKAIKLGFLKPKQ
jgi:DNA-binding transcriptional regulator YhcF (GntR family)